MALSDHGCNAGDFHAVPGGCANPVEISSPFEGLIKTLFDR